MIKGVIKTGDEPEMEPTGEEIYHYELDRFEGVPYRLYGIMDDFDNLKELLRVIGESVLKEENEFRKIQSEEMATEEPYPTDRVIDNWYRKEYRPFSYKALIIVIQSTFENAIVNLHKILKDSKRIDFELKNNYLLDNLKAFKHFEHSLNQSLEEVRVYNFIRNKLTHNNGYCSKTDKYFQEFQKFAANHTDIDIVELKHPVGGFTHKFAILKSSIINDMLSLNKAILTTLLRRARTAKEIAS